KLPILEFPAVETGQFEARHEAAAGGDISAMKELYSQVSRHIHDVYSPLEKNGGLLFSCRKPLKEFDDPENNYAVNLEHFFEETTDDVRIRKRGFKVQALDGSEYTVSFLEYNPADAAVKVKDGEESRWMPLTELVEKDRMFVENALMDDLFDSRSFEISIDDRRLRGEEMKTSNYKVAFSDGTRKDSSDFEKAETKAINRTIVLENEGKFPLKNLIVEYQVFVEQTIMGISDDFPEDYRCVGFFEVASLAPDEVKRLPLELPAVVNKQLQDQTSGNTRYSVSYGPGKNNYSEGRINGVCVRVHRITPYGERLMVDHKSSGTPSAKWTAVAPVGADIR
ncbi:MAG: hypothetical protein HKP10_07075, partial [Kiritimatiellales bacterium]|nr:hypothetical protein [Kiritimatiellales bacterium]